MTMEHAANGRRPGGLRSLEVRWFLPGEPDPAVAAWFGRFPAEMAVREDAYLVDPCLPGLSVKLRAGEVFEVKVHQGSPGSLDAGCLASGRMEFFEKWSFPFGPAAGRTSYPAGWLAVHKTRTVIGFRPAGRGVVPASPRLTGQPHCMVELTGLRVRDEAWWTLGFEATGPVDRLRSVLEGTAALVFARPPPGEVRLGPGNSRSYAEWLSLQPQC
jgi:hypothetical protein